MYSPGSVGVHSQEEEAEGCWATPHLAQPPFSQTNLYLRPEASPDTFACSLTGLPQRASPETSSDSRDQLTTLYLEVLVTYPLESMTSA